MQKRFSKASKDVFTFKMYCNGYHGIGIVYFGLRLVYFTFVCALWAGHKSVVYHACVSGTKRAYQWEIEYT